MNKILIKYFILGVFIPLTIFADETLILQEIYVQDKRDIKQEYKEENFYKSYSSTIITKEDMKEESATNISDIIKNVSNIRVIDRGGFSQSINIRGESGERVVSIVDGVKMSNHGITMGGGGELSLINASSVEKIEVVKGSPSVIYDPGATGGVVNVTTIKSPRSIKDGMKFNYTLNYDAGYKLIKHTANAEVKYKDIFVSINGSLAESKGRRVRDQAKQDSILQDLDEDFGTKYAIGDFGYTSDSVDALINYQLHEKANVYFKKYANNSSNITQVVGPVEPIVIQFVHYDREGDVLGINLKNVFGFNKIDIIHSNQGIYRATRDVADTLDEVTLDTNTKKIDAEYPLGPVVFLTGYEHTVDDADTRTLSQQTYDAFYLSAEYIQDSFTLTAGARYNKYHVTQSVKPGQNLDVVNDLVGISGVMDGPLDDDAINYSAGLVYSLNDFNNISFNYSRTYRYPSLFERFAFGGGFIGGGEKMQAEEANNYEISFKHLSKELSIVFTIFQSDFDTYNAFRVHSTLRSEYNGNLAAFLECSDNVDCDLYDSVFLFETFQDVQKRGFELDIEKKFIDQGVTVNFLSSLSHISDAIYQDENMQDPLTVPFVQFPLEFGLNIKKTFKYSYKPWLKLKLRYVTDTPEVGQEDRYGNKNFSAFGVADLHFGASNEMFVFNAGVRNLTDAVYHEPYSPLDGIERTVFFNIGIKLEKLL